jgi:hypothetical protein
MSNKSAKDLRRAPLAVIALLLFLAALLVQPGAAQQAKRVRVRGYVVRISSPTEFTLDANDIVDKRSYRVNAADVAGLAGSLVRIGADLEIEGRADGAEDNLVATTLRRRPPPEEKTPPTTTISTVVPIEPGERRLWNWQMVKVKEPNFDRHRSGQVSIRNNTHYEIIANAEVQQYVADLGARLIPSYQRDLADDDPAKIPFRFYVVRHDQAGAVAIATTILVYGRTFEILKNEAQIASVVAHEIAHVTQKHTWKLEGMAPSTFRLDFNRSYENQADRLALEYLVNAGYDPRESPRTWKELALKLSFSPLHETHDSFPVRRAFIMGELEANYQVDYSDLKTEEDRYTQIAKLVKKPY